MGTGTTRAMVLERAEELRLTEFPRPAIGDDAALLAVELAGICGTDVKTFHGKLPYPMPLIMGHEILGHVAEIGDGAAERWGLRVGDRVAVEGSVPCWSCVRCHTGQYRFCQRKRGRLHRPGGACFFRLRFGLPGTSPQVGMSGY